MALLFHLWPLIKEILASIQNNPELQQRSGMGVIAKIVIVLLIVALVALGDIALDSYNEVQKLKEERFQQRIVSTKEEKDPSISEDRVKFLLCEVETKSQRDQIDSLKNQLQENKDLVKDLQYELQFERDKNRPTNKPRKSPNDKRVQDRLNAIEENEDTQ